MTVPFVDLKAQYLGIKPEIDRTIQRVLDEASFIGGKNVLDFESKFAIKCGAKHVIAVGNGTDAIYIVLKMLGVGLGDEVITSATSWISTSETISQTGARPVFIDIDPATYTIDPLLIEEKITPRTKAILPVHLYGQMAHVETLRRICQKHELFLVEDCAQAHFSLENGIQAGKTGEAGTFSFYPGKNLGAYGDAGCIVTDNEELATKCKMFANHGGVKKHQHQMEGINSRMDSIQAAILNVKLDYISDWTESRISKAKIYHAQLKDLEFINVPIVRANTKHTFHLYVIRAERRDELKSYLERHGVQTAIHYPIALPNLPAYKYLGHASNEFPVASSHQNTCISLPIFPEMSENQMEYVCALIRRFYTK